MITLACLNIIILFRNKLNKHYWN